MRIKFALALMLLLALFATAAMAEGVEWTGLEWNGDTTGEVGARNCDIVQIGREPARTDSIPYASAAQAAEAAAQYNKSLSPYYLLLSQSEWQFAYYESPAAFDESADADFWQESFDASLWDRIAVPSVWQTEGYDHPIYTNTTQKFARNFGNEGIGYPRDLPKAPTIYNPIGLYRRDFVLPADWSGQRVYLTFEGVNSAFYVWVNGVQIGYAEDSFTSSEFDITSALRFGEANTIAVKVFRWCDGSWLEDQDYFDLSGIFRDVYLYAAPQVRVRDYSIVTDFDATFTDSTLHVAVDVQNHADAPQQMDIALTLFDAEGVPVPLEGAQQSATLPASTEQTLSFAIEVPAPRKWSAEDPYLYTLVLEEKTASATVYEAAQVGFRKITYKTTASGWYEGSPTDHDLIRINGQPISFKGVNRHEMHPEYGYALPKEVMEEDIRIMLENNINAVRTSHYPNSPYWYYLCDKYGIYVVDEANLECHSNMITENARLTEYMSAAIIDREYNMIRRDRNHASVVMWSLGNECKNPEILRTLLVQAYPDPEGVERVLHAYTADRPWHYEQARDMYETGIDLYSGMYYKVEALIAHGESDSAVPMIECEYEHAMGNAMGNMDEYWQAFDTYRNLQGGFIWDFVDQAIYAVAEDGTRYFGYGGDFGERVHDDNFCATGLVLPDRSLQPEMAEVRYHYQQVKFEAVDATNGRIRIKNFFLFTDIAEKYDLRWSLQQDDQVIASGMVDADLLHIPCVDAVSNQPGTAEVTIPFELSALADYEYFLNLSLQLKEADGLLPAGHEIAWEQFKLEPQSVQWQRDGDTVTIETDTLRVAFSKSMGRMVGYQALDATGAWRDLIVPGEGPQGDFVRASTDNDRAFGAGFSVYIGMWRDKGKYAVQSFSIDDVQPGVVTVRVEGAYPALNGMMLNATYAVHAEGFVAVDVTITPQYNENLVYLPVAGMSMRIPEGLEQLTWFGNGPEETYIDRYKGTKVGRWQSTVTDQYFPYVQSSETGNHVHTRWLILTDEKGFGLRVEAIGEPFEFSALHYTADELNRGVHPYELNAIEDTVLRINAIQAGVGGDDSWARIVTHEAYLPDDSEYRYGFTLSPILGD
ncbi:MAG: DUF4981 domain-containing protein [Oscillospiraceae bacterium]|nr:DUF4981 domain-containing protein [Oscillospiraceae bacterium]